MRVIILKYKKQPRALLLMSEKLSDISNINFKKYPIIEYRDSRIGDIFITRRQLR